MTDPPAFGRRQSPPCHSPPRRFAPPTEPAGPSLSAAAQAFAQNVRAEGALSGPPTEAGELKAWQSAQARQTLAHAALGLILMAPGVKSLLLNLSLPLSVGLEALGLLGNLWLRQARVNRRRQILEWTPNMPY